MVNRKLVAESGSAILEFLIFALPLFIPLVFFLVAINNQSRAQLSAENLSRQLARAYVTSPTIDLTQARMKAVLAIFAKELLAKSQPGSLPEVIVSCSATPCLTPSARVQVKVVIQGDARPIIASSTEIVDAWRSG